MADEPGTATVFFNNHFAPFTHGLGAPIFYVLAEVLVGKTARRFMGRNMTWTELLQVHVLSLPFIGPTKQFFDPPIKHAAWSKKKAAGEEIYGYGDQFMDGARGIPAVLLAEYILETFARGVHMPKFNFKEIAVTAFTKTITRPLSVLLLPYLPSDFQASYMVLESVFGRNANTARMGDEKEKVKQADQDPALWMDHANKKKSQY